MRQYANKEELISTINEKYKKYIAEFHDIPEILKNKRIKEVDKTPSENLSYQLGWINLLLHWEQKEQKGEEVHTPAEGYKWNKLSGLYNSFYKQYGEYSLKEQQSMLNEAVNHLCEWLNTLSEKELFEVDQRRWAKTQANWPVWKWVHINSVAPFTNFRTKIRKWKKMNL